MSDKSEIEKIAKGLSEPQRMALLDARPIANIVDLWYGDAPLSLDDHNAMHRSGLCTDNGLLTPLGLAVRDILNATQVGSRSTDYSGG